MSGQQSLISLISVVTSGCGGGQLMAVRVPVCAEAADAAVLTPPAAWAGGRPCPARPVRRFPDEDAMAGRVPLWQPVSVHSMVDAATGGTPLTQSGSGQALADAAGGGGPPLHAGEPLQALAAVAVKLSEPAVRAAEITAPAASRLT